MEWKTILGDEWSSLLNNFIISDNMSSIIYKVSLERQKYTVFPGKNEFYKMFRIFKELQPSNIKVIIIGQDPYPDGTGTGYSFCNNGKLPSGMSPSLRNILKEIENNDTEKDKLVIDEMDLQRWVDQGVFLVNSFLTVRKGEPGSHTFWAPFTKYWITQLNSYNNIVWLMWGRKSQEYIELIKNDTHEIIKSSHPSPLGANKSSEDSPAFLGSKCFEKVNNALWIRENKLIKW